jgi:hypothetical protein
MEDHRNAFRLREAYSPQYILSGIHKKSPVIGECIRKTDLGKTQ